MKKLFFAAALAIVAIGGALSTKATTWVNASNPSIVYDCNFNGAQCNQITPSQTVFNQDDPSEITTLASLPASERLEF